MEKIGFDGVLARVFKAAGCRTHKALANVLGIKPSAVSEAKKRNVIPAEWLIELLRQKGINPQWVLTGHEPRSLRAADYPPGLAAPHIVHHIAVRPPEKCSMQELVVEIVRRALGEMH